MNVVTLVSWLATEALGAFMVRSWVARGGAREAARQRRAGPHKSGQEPMSFGVLAGHVGLNIAGLLCWIVFVTTAAKPAAWLALVFMAPAIGLGISTVAIWTPYPGSRRTTTSRSSVVPEQVLRQALDDEVLATRLVDGLLERNLAPEPRPTGWHLRPLVPAGHGVLAVATFTLAVLSAVAAG
jgi:hypothetical protein